MKMYELNQAGYASLPTLAHDEVLACKGLLIDYLSSFDSNYYMLVNNEAHYYTLFTYKDEFHAFADMAFEVLALVEELGEIKSIERNGPMVEFWIVDRDGNCRMYPFFDYAKGVIEV